MDGKSGTKDRPTRKFMQKIWPTPSQDYTHIKTFQQAQTTRKRIGAVTLLVGGKEAEA
jgi:hypothetical protein